MSRPQTESTLASLPVTSPSAKLPPGEWDESQLLAALIADQPQAWREFEARYERRLYRCIERILRRFNRLSWQDDCREVYSALCLSLLARDKHKLRSYDPTKGCKLSSWLLMLASHVTYDHLRQRRREPYSSELTSEPIATATPSPFDVCVAREEARAVAEVLSDFTEKDRQFMWLYFGEGLEPEAVASTMGISVKTVYSKKHKIRARLEGLMGRRPLAA